MVTYRGLDQTRRLRVAVAAAVETSGRLSAASLHFDTVRNNLAAALDLAEKCGRAHKMGPLTRCGRQSNQAFFKRILVNADGTIEPELAQPFDVLLGPSLAARPDDR